MPLIGDSEPRSCTRIIGHLEPDQTKPIRCGQPSTYMIESVNIETGWSTLDPTCKGCAGSELSRRESAEQREAHKQPE